MGTVLMGFIARLFVSALSAVVCCLLVRGGQEADRVVRSASSPLVPADHVRCRRRADRRREWQSSAGEDLARCMAGVPAADRIRPAGSR